MGHLRRICVFIVSLAPWVALLSGAGTASLAQESTRKPDENVADASSSDTSSSSQEQAGKPAEDAKTPPQSGEDHAYTLPPVKVSARKWDENVQDVPMSVQVVGEKLIEDAGIRSIKDASFFVPNLYVNEFSARRLSFPVMRGVGSGQGDPAVTTYIDGVPQLSVSTSSIPLLDVESIEFLRGPQGTLYGRNSIGGLMHYKTRRPTEEFFGDAKLTFGDYNLREESISVSGPITKDELGFGLSVMNSQRDGYTENLFTGDDVDDRNSIFGRGQLVWKPNSRDEFRLVLYGEGADDGPFVLADIRQLEQNPHKINQDFEGENNRNLFSSSVAWDHAGDDFDVTNVLAYVDWGVTETSDFDFTTIDGIRRRTEDSQNYLNHEIRVSTKENEPVKIGGDARLRWLAGMHTFVSDASHMPSNEFRPGGAGIFFPPSQVGTDTTDGDFNDFGTALYTQATVTLFEHLDVAAGVRFDYENKRARLNHTFETGGFTALDTTTHQSDDYGQWTPMGSLAYHFTDDLMTYARVAKGFKAGGYNNAATNGQFAFKPETSISYELGEKSNWFGDRLSLNASVFYIDWQDMQLTVFDPTVGGRVDNAGKATSKGFEVELVARPLEGLDLIAGYGYTDAEFDEYVDSFGIDDSGNNIPFAPETTRNLGVQYSHSIAGDWRGYARADWFRLGPYFYDASNLQRQSYELVNFRVGFACPRVRIEGFLNNAFDEDYIPIAFQFNPADPTFFIGESGVPRTVGVSVGVTF